MRPRIIADRAPAGAALATAILTGSGEASRHVLVVAGHQINAPVITLARLGEDGTLDP